MDKQRADSLIAAYLPKVYGYAVKKALFYDEAEELCSAITEELYASFLRAEVLYNPDGYVWRVCQHVYAKFVAAKKQVGISIDGLELPYEQTFFDGEEEEIYRLRREIAFLTETRREIVFAFYYRKESIPHIARRLRLPEGTVKWHLNKARNTMKEGFGMERKIGKLGLSPVVASGFGHSGTPNGDPTEVYLEDKLNLNIVYSVYHTPRTREQIAEELGVTPVYVEDPIRRLEQNGFLVPTAGKRYTTYVNFSPTTYSKERQDRILRGKWAAAEQLVREYVPLVREAVADITEVYIPGGNRELFEAAAVMLALADNCMLPFGRDLSRYVIKTTAGGEYKAFVQLVSTPVDPEYRPEYRSEDYWMCGLMTRGSCKYPGLFSWSTDTRHCSREGSWKNNHTVDYEYLYEYITGTITDTPANAEKFARLRERQFLTPEGAVGIMVLKGDGENLKAALPRLTEEQTARFTAMALEYASAIAAEYPPQMQDLILAQHVGQFLSSDTPVMVQDILYSDGTFRPLTEVERVTANLMMYCDTLPRE